jgi:ABC-type dipeptide/oligopeptide/nickel transport system permease subunit
MNKLQHTYLMLGAFWVGLFTLAAIFAPWLAPHDPLQTNPSIAIGEKRQAPPVAPFRTLEYPLGTDEFGRDLLSRVLWGLRPTLQIALLAAGIRLLVGTFIGILAGWGTGRHMGWLARWANVLISFATTVPVLLVALSVLASLGVEGSSSVFILGITLSGWGAVAELVQTQTRLVRRQDYVTASFALGAKTPQAIWAHLLPHIFSLLWILLAYEMSSVLIVLAELGFLGYFLGGGAWVATGDFVAEHTSGKPELGQLLATAFNHFTQQPSQLLWVGGVLILAIVGFNFLGEGLRQQADKQNLPLLGLARLQASWVSARQRFAQSRRWLLPLASVVLVSVIAGWGWQAWQARQSALQAQAIFQVPGGHHWNSQYGNAYGTLTSANLFPSKPNLQWAYFHPGGFSGGAAVAADGTLYINTQSGELLAIDPTGTLLWQFKLPQPAVGTPAISADNILYLSDHSGGLLAMSTSLVFQWYLPMSGFYEATAGPIIAPNGTILYPLDTEIRAVHADGTLLWQTRSPNQYIYEPLRLTLDGKYVTQLQAVFDLASGELAEFDLRTGQNDAVYAFPAFFSGADARQYVRVGHAVYPNWQFAAPFALASAEKIGWDGQSLAGLMPQLAGVTPQGRVWFLYGNEYTNTRLVWLAKDNEVQANVRLESTHGQLIGVDAQGRAVVCGATQGVTGASCGLWASGASQPQWQFVFPDGGFPPLSGAVAPNRIYLSSADGWLYAIGD